MNGQKISTAAKRGRWLAAALTVLLLVAAVQVVWWIYDQRNQDAMVAAAMSIVTTGSPGARDAAIEALRVSRVKRQNQYAWEGAFFLLVFTACIAVVWRGLRSELAARQRQETFLALVSHQFKTPLASLKLAIETITLRKTNPERTEQLAARALDDVQRLEDLVANILESARLDAGRVELRQEPVSLARHVAQSTDRLNERAERSGVHFSVTVDPDVVALADPVAVDAVLRNLLENAVASVAPNGGGRVDIRGRTEGTRVIVEVRDPGVGFDPADTPALFEKFGFTELAYRAGERTGLGLYIVRRLMELGGGTVDARSHGLGHGASFTVAWPRAMDVTG